MNQPLPESTIGKRAELPLPGYARVAGYGVAWLPLPGLFAFLVPKFAGVFDRLRENGEVPAITEWLLRLTSLNKTLFFVPCLLVLVLLVIADMGVAGLLRRSGRERLYGAWFVCVVAAGILAVVVAMSALLLPFLKATGSS